MTKEFFYLGTSLILIAVVFSSGCGGTLPGESGETENSVWYSDDMRWLTNEEKVEAIEVALNTPEALRQLESESICRIGLDWIALFCEDSEYTTWWVLDYEVVETGIPAYVPQAVVIYPRVMLHFGEPEEWQVMVAVDLEAGEAVIIDENPPREEPMYFPKENQ